MSDLLMQNYVQRVYQRSAQLQSLVLGLKQDNERLHHVLPAVQDEIEKRKKQRRELLNSLLMERFEKALKDPFHPRSPR